MSIPPPNGQDPVCHSVNEDIHIHYIWPRNFTHLWWTLWLIVHGRSCNFLFNPPQGSLPNLMLGDYQTIIFLWHCLVVTSLRSRLTGVGLVCPCLAWSVSMCKECQLLMQWGGAGCDVGCVNFHTGPSLHMRGHLSWSDVLPHEACPPIYHWSFSSLEKHLPWPGWDCQASIWMTPIFQL